MSYLKSHFLKNRIVAIYLLILLILTIGCKAITEFSNERPLFILPNQKIFSSTNENLLPTKSNFQQFLDPDIKVGIALDKLVYNQDENIEVIIDIINTSGKKIIINDRFALENNYPGSGADINWLTLCSSIKINNDYVPVDNNIKLPEKSYRYIESGQKITLQYSFPVLSFFHPAIENPRGECSLVGVYINTNEVGFHSGWEGVSGSNEVPFYIDP